jgi:hypothetical protein
MRDRLLDLLPLLLVGTVLGVFYFWRAQGTTMAFIPLPTPASASVAAPRPTLQPLVVSAQRALTTQDGLCNPSRPVFLRGMASLKAALGARMGDALECERVVDAAGNTQQRTSAGLAYYRRGSNAACFTTGSDHWALVLDRELVFWTGDVVDPPANASDVTH